MHFDSLKKMGISEKSLAHRREDSDQWELFIAALGHDLRNALAAITSGTQLLARTPLDEKATQVVGLMESSAEHMGQLIGNVLDFARSQLGIGLLLEHEVKPIEPVLQRVIDELKVSWPDRQIETSFRFAAPFAGDHGRLAQLFSSLLGNALTHGSADAPVLIEATQDGKKFRLAVANAGKPIPPDTLQQLFQPLYQEQAGQRRRGLGLGLFIASEIARAHGGQLDVASSSDETRFTLTIPTQST